MPYNKQTPEITSPSNQTFRRFKALLGSKGIRTYGEALVSGQKIVSDLCKYHPDIIQRWIVSPKTMSLHEQSPNRLSYPYTMIDEALFRELDIFGTHYPLLHVTISDIMSESQMHHPDSLVLYLPFQDPSNVGAVVRSAAAFGVTSLVLLEEAAHPFHPKSIRASAGAVFDASFYQGPSLSKLKQEHYPLVGLDSDGEKLSSFTFPVPCGLVPGLEGQGLNDAPSFEHTIAIPMLGNVESLNAVVATSIALYEWQAQTRARNKRSRT